MSTPDTQHMIRVVAEKFEVKGWKPTNCVTGATYKGLIASCGCGATNVQGPHEVPPPDLLSPDGAWALLVALPCKANELFAARRLAESSQIMEHLHEWLAQVPYENDALALLTAAFQLTEEGRKDG